MGLSHQINAAGPVAFSTTAPDPHLRLSLILPRILGETRAWPIAGRACAGEQPQAETRADDFVVPEGCGRPCRSGDVEPVQCARGHHGGAESVGFGVRFVLRRVRSSHLSSHSHSFLFRHSADAYQHTVGCWRSGQRNARRAPAACSGARCGDWRHWPAALQRE